MKNGPTKTRLRKLEPEMTPKVHNVLFDVWYTIYAPQKHTFQHFPKTQPLTDSTFRPAMAQGQSRYVQRLYTKTAGIIAYGYFGVRTKHPTPTCTTLFVFTIAPVTYMSNTARVLNLHLALILSLSRLTTSCVRWLSSPGVHSCSQFRSLFPDMCFPLLR